jgi:hypothetical protein
MKIRSPLAWLMTMRAKLLLPAFLLMCSATLSTQTMAKDNLTEEQQSAYVTQIKQRMEQIRLLDLPSLGKKQRSDLRHELKGMKSQLQDMKPVAIVITLSALIVVILVVLVLI